MNRQKIGLKRQSRTHGAGDSIRDIVQLQVKEQLLTWCTHPPNASRAVRGEEFEPELDSSLAADHARQRPGAFMVGGVDGDEKARQGHGAGDYGGTVAAKQFPLRYDGEPMSNRSIIRSDDLVPRPWKNGQGVTWEIAIDPPGAGLDDFRWRVSRARIEAEGPFSSFPGCERWITCVEGAGFALHFEDGVKLAVPPFVPVRFAGDRPVLCRLAGGPCTDINVMARRDLVRVAVAVVAAPTDLPAGAGSAKSDQDEILVRLDPSRALRVRFQAR
jgi:environmental stress-induced protein Ves